MESIISGKNNEDKNKWCKGIADNIEPFFVSFCKDKKLFDSIEINPSKSTKYWEPDLLVNGKIAELKNFFTPFFTASRYGYDPQYTYTFGLKDFLSYREKYPTMDIYVFYNPLYLTASFGGKDFKIEYFGGIFVLNFQEIEKLLIRKQAPFHEHKNRRNDTKGNDKGNYLIDIRDFKQLYSFPKPIKIPNFWSD